MYSSHRERGEKKKTTCLCVRAIVARCIWFNIAIASANTVFGLLISASVCKSRCDQIPLRPFRWGSCAYRASNITWIVLSYSFVTWWLYLKAIFSKCHTSALFFKLDLFYQKHLGETESLSILLNRTYSLWREQGKWVKTRLLVRATV